MTPSIDVVAAGRPAEQMVSAALEPYRPIPAVRRITNAILKNEAGRPPVAWGSADFSRLSAPRQDALWRITSSILFGEVHGRAIYASLLVRLPYRDLSDGFAAQILDEDHHARILSRYVVTEMRRPIASPLLAARYAVVELKRLRDPLIATLAASLFVECTAGELVAELATVSREPLLTQILRTILRDEGRHKALGREAALVLLDLPTYRRRWARQKARLYRVFNDRYCRFVFGRYARWTRVLDFDVDAVHRRAMAAIHDAVPL